MSKLGNLTNSTAYRKYILLWRNGEILHVLAKSREQAIRTIPWETRYLYDNPKVLEHAATLMDFKDPNTRIANDYDYKSQSRTI